MQLNLRELRQPLELALEQYQRQYFTFKFEKFSDLHPTPEKPNHARTVVPISYRGTYIGNMYVIVFLPGDATGDENSYKLNQVVIPSHILYQEKTSRVIPRAKKGIVCEGFFPLFSQTVEGRIVPFAASLEELTLDEQRRVVPAWTLGMEPQEYVQALQGQQEIFPTTYFTVGTNSVQERFGDPHCVHHQPRGAALQVAGFLSISEENSPLLSMTERWLMPVGKY